MRERRLGEGQISMLAVALGPDFDQGERLGHDEYATLASVSDALDDQPDDGRMFILDGPAERRRPPLGWYRLDCDLRFCVRPYTHSWPDAAVPYYVMPPNGILVPILHCRPGRDFIEFAVLLAGQGDEPFLATGSERVYVTDQPAVAWRHFDKVMAENAPEQRTDCAPDPLGYCAIDAGDVLAECAARG